MGAFMAVYRVSVEFDRFGLDGLAGDAADRVGMGSLRIKRRYRFYGRSARINYRQKRDCQNPSAGCFDFVGIIWFRNLAAGKSARAGQYD